MLAGTAFAIVDAFTTTRPFSGNPAGVVLLDEFPDDAWMQGVANELHQSETAFLIPDEDPGGFRLRWFTPVTEVALCGHATLASAHRLWESGTLPHDSAAAFATRSGRLTAEHHGEHIVLDFPAVPATQVSPSADLVASLRGTVPVWTGITANDDPGERNMLAVLESEELVHSCSRTHNAPLPTTLVQAREGTAGRLFNPARPTHTRSSALRISHFPDPQTRRYARDLRPGRGHSNLPVDNRREPE